MGIKTNKKIKKSSKFKEIRNTPAYEQSRLAKRINNIEIKPGEKRKRKSNKDKKFHLTVDQANKKIKALQSKLQSLTGPSNKNKRRYIFQKLSKL